MAAEAWQDFGQKVDLTARIREILLNYPEGTSILKELVQNADDARATCIKFCLDCRQHGTVSLLSPSMAAFQGPALLAFNDGVFSDRDLQSISRIGDSKKKEEEGKTGRFGVGFNSCYHLTDVPSFVSGRHLVIFDPHCRHLPNISSTNPGKRIDFVQYGDVTAQYKDQVAPYAGAFGCTLGVAGAGSTLSGPWPGTIFRFPLRSVDSAVVSTISKQVYTVESIRTLLEQLAMESFQILLFLKHISRVEVHEWPPDAQAPHLLFSCYVSNLSKEVIWERGLFARVSGDRSSHLALPLPPGGSAAGGSAALPQVLSTYRLELRREWHSTAAAVRRPERRSYIVSQMRGGGEVAELAEQLSKLFGSVVAWGAVAADVTTMATRGGGDSGAEGKEEEGVGPSEDGRAFCFLPLPIRTGLPVHVNGYFELSSNRRDIWYGEDMTGSGARRAQWNMQLLLRVIAPAYTAALQAAAVTLGHGDAYDRLWPAVDVSEPWQSLLVEFFRSVVDMALCWSPVRGGTWVAPRAGVLQDQAAADSQHLATALVAVAKLPLLELPPRVGKLMLRHMINKPRVCSPMLARQALLEAITVSELSSDTTLRSHAPVLLDYCMSDLLPAITAAPSTPQSSSSASLSSSSQLRELTMAPSGLWVPSAPAPASVGTTAPAAHPPAPSVVISPQVAQAAAQLVGLQLLPLRDGTTATLLAAGGRQPQRAAAGSFFLPSTEELTLLVRAGGLFVDTDELSPMGRAKLAALAAVRVLNVAQLDASAMAAVVLPRLLPPTWLTLQSSRGRAVVDWQTDAAAAALGIDRDWLELLWRWLATHGPMSSFLGLPLLPITGGRLALLADAASSIAILPQPETFSRRTADANPADAAASTDPAAQLSEMFTQLGLQIVDLASFPNLPVSELVRNGYVHCCDGPGILAALQRLSAAPYGRTVAAAVQGHASADGITEAQSSDASGGRGRSVLSVGLAARVAALAAVDKRLLRSVLLTEDCLMALTASGHVKNLGGSTAATGKPPPLPAEARGLLQLLAALPIFESARGAVSAGSTGVPSRVSVAESVFVPLYGTDTCYLVPSGVDIRVLGATSSEFVVAASEAEGLLMVSYLGVRAITAAETYRHHVLPVLASLPVNVRNAAVLGVLRGLPQLSAQDRGFGSWLAQVSFLPNNKGELHTPGELYDPRNPDLAALLDPEADFPAASLLLEAAGDEAYADAAAGVGTEGASGPVDVSVCEGVSDGEVPLRRPASDGVMRQCNSNGGDGGGDASLVLYMLQQLGLRTKATLDTLLRAARFVERVADDDDAMPVVAAISVTSAVPEAKAAGVVACAAPEASIAKDSDMAVARGKALLTYLEVEAGRIMGPVGAASAAALGAGQLPGGGGSVGAVPDSTGEAFGGGAVGGSSSGPGAGARKFAAGLFSKARELFGQQGSNQQPALAEIHSFWQELARVRWCPVLQEPPAPGLPWPPRHAVPRLAAPRTVRPPNDTWLCSSCMFLVDGECRSSALAAGLGWSTPLSGSVLAQQLLQLGELHTRVVDPSLSQVLAGVVPLLYRSLAALGLHEAPVARGLLYGSRCVWVGNGFALAGKVAFKGSLDLSPWLYVLPAELAPFKDLLLSYGAADGFSAVQYCNVLKDMADATGASSVQGSGTVGDVSPGPQPHQQPLTELQLGQVVAVSQALADLTLPPGATIFLPDERGVLAKAADLAFNDAPWLAGQPSSASVRLVHPRISAHVAARLGTPSLRRLLLAASADCMALGTVGGAEAFGQSEALTTRLRHIIGDYPEGPGVLMELLQNADDAGATSLELLLDDTTYPAASILSPAMAMWQGPALLVANDALFSPSDFANISRIGQDSKASRPTSIGRFGLGFNAVYHFTDLPCFVSGDYLVMFDPHAKYLPGVSAAQPGLKIAFARAQLLQQFPDAFTPFTHLGCNMRERFMGTLFRFPLRNLAAAAASNIKTSPCYTRDVAVLLESFRRQLPSALLFLKNICSVTAFYRSAESANRAEPGPTTTSTTAASANGSEGSLRLLFRASRDVVATASASGSAREGATAAAAVLPQQLSALPPRDGESHAGLLQTSIARFVAAGLSSAADLPTFYKRLANTPAVALPAEMGLMRLRMETDPTLPPGDCVAAVVAGNGGDSNATTAADLLLADANAAVPATFSEEWLVCNALGGGGARELALKSFRNHGTKMVPWVGVAALVPKPSDENTTDTDAAVAASELKLVAGENSTMSSELDGRAFCFLPLPIRTGLPVHVNAYFELSSNRRDIWYGGDMSGAGAARSSWNVALLSDALAPAYGRVLVAVAQRVGPGEQLYRLLPSLETPPPWLHLVTALYKQHLKDLPIVWTRAGGGRWISPSVALFSDASCSAKPLLRNLLVALGLPLACSMPAAAEARLLRGVPSAIAVGPHHVRQHLAQMFRAAAGDSAAMAQQLAAAVEAAVSATIGDASSPTTQSFQVVDIGGAPKRFTPLAASVAALLQYCLSDLDVSVSTGGRASSGGGAGGGGGQLTTAQTQPHLQQQQQQLMQRLQQDLDGLPLLPLADGSLGRLQALQGVKSAARGRQAGPAGMHAYVLTHGSLELELLSGLRDRCLAPGLPEALVERLQQVVDLRLFNVQRLSTALLETTLLPLLLPPSWHGALEVRWTPQPSLSPVSPATSQLQQGLLLLQSDPVPDIHQSQQPSTTTAGDVVTQAYVSGPSAEWLRALWAWLADREDVLQLASWPVLPMQGGRLGRLQDKSLVLREGGWTEGVSTALLRLGCRLLDTALLAGFETGMTSSSETSEGRSKQMLASPAASAAAAAAAVASPALQACVQQPSLTGVLSAIATAKARANAIGPGKVSSGALLDLRQGLLPSPTSSGAAADPASAENLPWADRLSSLSAVERRQLRSYLLQGRWFMAPTPPLNPSSLDLLRSLPLFEVVKSLAQAPDSAPTKPIAVASNTVVTPTAHGTSPTAGSKTLEQPTPQPHQTPATQHFVALDLTRHRLAPADTDPRVLSSSFLRAESPAEEALLEQHLGVPRLSPAELLEQHVGPHAAELPRGALEAHVAGLLGRLVVAPVGAEAQRLRLALSEHPLIPTASPAGELRRPAELHDPRVATLTSLLPPDSAYFPSHSLTVPGAGAGTTRSTASATVGAQGALPLSHLLDALALLGMARAVDLRVLVTAANVLHADHAAWVTTATAAGMAVKLSPAAAVMEESLMSRSRALLKELERWAVQYGTSRRLVAGAGLEEDPKRAWGQLSGLSWCPVMREAPEPGLPWPSIPGPILAPPRVVRLPSDAWLVGATLHILERPVVQQLQAVLGWNTAPRVSVLAAQLIELGRLHAFRPKPLVPADAPPLPLAAGAPSPSTAAAADVAEDGRESGVNSETGASSSADVKDREKAVADKAASTLTKAIDSAVHRLYGALTTAVEGPEGDLVVMSFERPDTPCVWMGTGFVLPGVAVLRSDGDFRPYLWVIPEPLHQYTRLLSIMGVMDRFTAQHYASGLAALTAAAGGHSLDDDSLALALQLADCTADAAAAHGRPLGQVFVPDATAVMTPAPELFFNDAEWLDAQDVQMAHGALPQATAEALGVRSLRYAHEVEAQLMAVLPCPSPAELRERLGLTEAAATATAAHQAERTATYSDAAVGAAAAAMFLFELLEVADALGLRSLRLVLDVRQHPAQSLLQPALAEFQGPALCVVLPELVLSAEDLGALLCSRAQPPSIRGRVTAYSAGLQSAFLVSELLQVVSGNSTYMFDPSGAYLGSGGESTMGGGSGAGARGGGGGGRGRAGVPTPRAKQYVHVSSDLLSTFADQFTIWSFADGYDIRKHVNATLLRLPLGRSFGAASTLATSQGSHLRGLRSGGLAVGSLESVEAALQQFAVHGPRSLLFLNSLTGIELSLLRPQPAPTSTSTALGTKFALSVPMDTNGRCRTAHAPARDLLLQASMVTLDSERPRPDFAAAATAASRQRSGGPAAFKALAQAFGRSLGRGGGGQENPRQYLSPLELHVMAHNALLMKPVDGELESALSAAGMATSPGSRVQASGNGGGSGGAGGSALNLLSGGGVALGSTLYRERWLVASCLDLDAGPMPPSAAAAGGRPELIAAAAVCIARDEAKNLFPVSGLYAPIYLPPAPGPSSAVGGGSGSALGRMPFLIVGHFYLTRRNGKHIVPPFARSEGAGPSDAVAASGGGGGSGSGSTAVVPPAMVPHLQYRCDHNRRILDLAATAWQQLALYFCSQDQYIGPRERLYDIFPDMTVAANGGGAGAVDETALYCIRQMYGAASRLPLWRLRTGRFVHLPEGCFLQPTTEGLGPAAMGFMARQLPLFDVPWQTKQHLQAADVHGLRTVSPAVVRPLLKNLCRRQGATGAAPGSIGSGAGKVVWPGLTVLEATELLQFCSADLIVDEKPPAGVAVTQATGPRRQAAGATPPAGAPSAGVPGTSSSSPQQQSSRVGGLLDELTSQVRNVMGELVGPALYDQLRQQALGMLGDAAPTTQQTGIQGASSAAEAAAPLPLRYHTARLLDCRGLPVPTAAGTIESLGSTSLLVAPPLSGLPSPAALMPPHCASEFAHPDCVSRMTDHLKDAQYRSSLELRLYTLDDLARHLRSALPPGWDHPMAPPAATAAQGQQQQQVYASDLWVSPVGLGRAWDGGIGGHGDGPSGLWLWQLWTLVNGLLDVSPDWQVGSTAAASNDDRLEALHHWPLLPTLGSNSGAGVLLPVRHCQLVICLPPPHHAESSSSASQGKVVDNNGGKSAAAPVEKVTELAALAATGPVPALRELTSALPTPWNWLALALHVIGCPLLDPRFRTAVGRHCGPLTDGLPARQLAEAAAVTGAPGTRGSTSATVGAALAALVGKMRLCNTACGGALPQRCDSQWDDTTRVAMLGLLSESTPTNIDPADIIFLRRLPIYPTHAGGYTALEEEEGAAASQSFVAGVADGAAASTPKIAPVVCPTELLHLVPGLSSELPTSLRRRLLLPQPGASRLFTLLGLVSLNIPTFLATVVLPSLGSLPEGVRTLLLMHVLTSWSRLRSNEALVSALRDVPFVITANGVLKRPCELYDPENPLFAAAFLGCPVFPRDQFARASWLSLLRDVGLQHTMSGAVFMAAVEAVAERGAALHMTLMGEGVPEEGVDLEDPFLSGGASEIPAAVVAARTKVTSAAEQLVAHLVGPQGRTLAPAEGGGREWWAALARVKFVPATLGLPGSRRARQVLTRYCDAASASDWSLVWSVLPMVAAERQLPAALGHGQLRIKSPPPLAAVVAHLRRVGADSGEEALSAWPASAGSVEGAFRAVLSYLDKEGVSGHKAAQLRDVAFVPVARGTLLAPPQRLYVRLKEDFAPFAFEVPPSLASFTPLLKSLGAKDELRAQDMVESLRALAAAFGPQPLSPNQRAAVLRLLTHIAALGGAGTAVGGGAAAGRGGGMVGGSASDLAFLNTARRERCLLVLSADGRLVPAHSVVSVSEGGGAGAGRLLGRVDPGVLTLAHPGLSEGVTRWLGCPCLGDVAEERLDPAHPLEPVEGIQGLSLRDGRLLLASSAFVSACHALLRSHAPLVRGMTSPGSLHEVAAVLRAAAPRLMFVRSLHTIAVLRATGAALSSVADTSRVAFDFVEAVPLAGAPPAGDRTAAVGPPPFGVITTLAVNSGPGPAYGFGRIFIAEPPAHLPVSWLLASVVSRVLGSPVVLPLQPLFTTPAGELPQLQPVLLPGGFDVGLETMAQAGTPGAPLLPSDAVMLQLKPLRRYCAGEVVAYQRTTAIGTTVVPATVAAAAAAERRLQSGIEVTSEQAGAVVSAAVGCSNMCYGRVAAHCASPDAVAAAEGVSGSGGGGGGSGAVRRVLVEVEPGLVQHLLSTQVFCFRSSASDSAARDAAPSTTAAPAVLVDTYTSAATAGATPSSSQHSLGAAGLTMHLPAAVPSSGGGDLTAPLSASEMVGAVRDLMAAAGLPLDTAAGQLMGRVATLQEQLAEVQRQLVDAQREAAVSAGEAEAVRSAWQCKICFSRDVDSAYTGCGHTICARCAATAASNRCPVCRKSSQTLLRLYRA